MHSDFAGMHPAVFDDKVCEVRPPLRLRTLALELFAVETDALARFRFAPAGGMPSQAALCIRMHSTPHRNLVDKHVLIQSQ